VPGDDDQPDIPVGNLGPPFDHPKVVAKLRSLSAEVAKYRLRRTAAERDAKEARAAAETERQRREAVEAAFRELTLAVRNLEVQEPPK
jgi:hypothetical protein